MRTQILPLVLGATRFGEWCEGHALPHLAVAAVYVLDDDGPRRVGRVRTCVED